MHIDVLLKQVISQLSVDKTQGHNAATDTLRADIVIDKSWAQGRTVFGGLTSAIAYQAIACQVTDGRLLRSLSINFIAPIQVGESLKIYVEQLRHGKNVSQYQARIMQNEQVCLLAMASFGVERVSSITVTNTDRQIMAPPKKPSFLPPIPGVVPKFLRHIDLALVDSRLPFTNSKRSDLRGWMRFSEAPQSITDAHIITLIDSWPPAVLQMLKWPAPASTMSWNIEFIHPHRRINPSNWFAYQVQTRQAADGYAHTEANVWDSYGELIAISRQVVTVFDGKS
ncbi:acyl-CoA thioesterase [Thalassotalea maritima]|uniref:acyl-CoA thioesterase n=1 Tax=Thalassotalea maritima TaxID=3242416 RepID=UPI003529B457